MYRSRVRTQLKGPKTCFKKIRSQVTHDVVTNKDAEIVKKNLPERGLNEVFVGELDATEPSYLEIEINQSGHWQRIKCSGVLISTGTGSTAWSQSGYQAVFVQFQNEILLNFRAYELSFEFLRLLLRIKFLKDILCL